MSEYKKVHDILQRIDDDLIDEAVSAKRTHFPIRKLVAAAAGILVCVFLSVGAAAAISPTFGEWMMEQFQSKQLTLIEAFSNEKQKEDNGYECFVTYSATGEQRVISLTEEEIEKVLEMIKHSESEVMSSENGNMKYAEKAEISIELTVQSDDYEFTYTLAVAEENILTYSIEKKSLDSGDVTEKHYVIYSGELYDMVMEKTKGGEQNEK